MRMGVKWSSPRSSSEQSYIAHFVVQMLVTGPLAHAQFPPSWLSIVSGAEFDQVQEVQMMPAVQNNPS